MCCTQRLVFAALWVLAAMPFAGAHAATPTGQITFSGLIVDGNTPFPPGAVLTIHGIAVTRSGSCTGIRVPQRKPRPPALLWLCSPPAPNQIVIGSPITARARVTGIKQMADGNAPYSDTFVLFRSD